MTRPESHLSHNVIPMPQPESADWLRARLGDEIAKGADGNENAVHRLTAWLNIALNGPRLAPSRPRRRA